MKPSLKTATRALVALLALGVVLTPTLVAGSGDAATTDPKFRQVSPPNVFYPVTGTRSVRDLKTYNTRHRATDIKAPCGVNVYATHPGVAQIIPGVTWAGKALVRVVSSSAGTTTYYGYLSRAVVTNNQPVQSGQWIGSVGRRPANGACQLYFSVFTRGVAQNASSWLSYYVGRIPPVGNLFNAPGINVASFNVLGASHTRSGGRFATAAVRMPKEWNLIQRYRTDVVGFQELQDEQAAQFMSLSGGQFESFHWRGRPDGPGDTDNSIAWRTSTMELVSTDTYDIPYFGGNIRHVPIVLLRQKATGRTAYFLNVHNPADVQGPAQRWRNQAVAIEKAKIVELRQTGRPVFLTGDFNDRQEAFCPLTANKLSISPNSVPNYACAYPRQSSIDWIFAAGQTRFSYFVRDTSTQSSNISDHPFVFTRAHLQN